MNRFGKIFIVCATSCRLSELTDDYQIPQLPYVEDDLYDRLTDHLISFCRKHPELIPYAPIPSSTVGACRLSESARGRTLKD